MARSVYRGNWKYANWKTPWRGPTNPKFKDDKGYESREEIHEKKLLTLARKMFKVNTKEAPLFPEGAFLVIDNKEKSAAVIPADNERARAVDFEVPGYNVSYAIRNAAGGNKRDHYGSNEIHVQGLPPIFGDNEAAEYNNKTYKQEYRAEFFPHRYPAAWSNAQDLAALEELAQAERAKLNVKDVVGNLDMLISSLLGQGMAKKSFSTDYYGKTHSCVMQYKSCTIEITSTGTEEV